MAGLKRETLMAELVTRVANVTGNALTVRNPANRPSTDNMPLVAIMDFPARVLGTPRGSKTQKPVLKVEFKVVMEVYVAGTTEEDATSELMTFFASVLSAIFTDGCSLGGLGCLITITDFTRVLRPPIGQNAAGIGTLFNIEYVEDFSNL